MNGGTFFLNPRKRGKSHHHQFYSIIVFQILLKEKDDFGILFLKETDGTFKLAWGGQCCLNCGDVHHWCAGPQQTEPECPDLILWSKMDPKVIIFDMQWWHLSDPNFPLRYWKLYFFLICALFEFVVSHYYCGQFKKEKLKIKIHGKVLQGVSHALHCHTFTRVICGPCLALIL